jgi:membrane protein
MSPSRSRPSRALGQFGGPFVWLKEFIADLQESRTTGRAAEMAFWLFLSLVPLAAVAGLVVAKLAVSNKDVTLLLASLPAESRDLVAKQLHHVAGWNGGSVGLPAAIVFVWLGSGGIHAVFDVLEVKAHETRSWWKKRALALATCVALSIGLALIGALATGLGVVLDFARGTKPIHELEARIGMSGVLDGAFRIGIGGLTALCLVAGLYFVGIPRKARRRATIFPGAILAVLLQAALGYGYVFYLSKVGVNSAYQAGLSIIGVTMIALYLFSVALLVGAELNHLIGLRKRSMTR